MIVGVFELKVTGNSAYSPPQARILSCATYN